MPSVRFSHDGLTEHFGVCPCRHHDGTFKSRLRWFFTTPQCDQPLHKNNHLVLIQGGKNEHHL
jgi:hypothetical protein